MNSTLFLIFIFQFSSASFTSGTKEIVNNKANFIWEVAYNIYYTKSPKSKTFHIGIYGRDVEAKAIYAKLSHITQGLSIDGKSVNVHLFKYMRSVEAVDVIYVSGNAKIRLGDLHEILSVRPYSLITKNYPNGSSAINVLLDKNDELIFEIQSATLRKNGASVRRKLLENRQRISSASQWESAKSGNTSTRNYRKEKKQGQILIDSIIADSIKLDSIAKSLNKAEAIKPVVCDCSTEIKTAVEKANSKSKYIAILALLCIGGLGYYANKLKKKLQ